MSDCNQLLTVSGGFHFWIGKVLAELAVFGTCVALSLVVAAIIFWQTRSKP